MTALTDPRVKLRHLQAFAAVARDHTVQHAAEGLSLTASAVSKALQELEAIVERPLFRRTRKGLMATAEGEQLLRVFADHQMDMQRHGFAQMRQAIQRGHGHFDFVTHAVDIQYQMRRLLLDQRTA